MDRKRLDEQTAADFFREQVERAVEHQKLETSAFVAGYLVDLLARSVRTDALPVAEPGFDDVPLALLYLRALQQPTPQERARRLREMGDTALFISGFFALSLGEDGELRYYRRLGGDAYARLGRERSWFGGDVFSELAVRFQACADVLAEVSEASGLGTAPSLVRLYERWLQTGSRRAARLLQEHGIAPAAPTGDGRAH